MGRNEKMLKVSNSGDGSCVPSVASVTLRDAERFLFDIPSAVEKYLSL